VARRALKFFDGAEREAALLVALVAVHSSSRSGEYLDVLQGHSIDTADKVVVRQVSEDFWGPFVLLDLDSYGG
jgi:hypothetical protein